MVAASNGLKFDLSGVPESPEIYGSDEVDVSDEVKEVREAISAHAGCAAV